VLVWDEMDFDCLPQSGAGFSLLVARRLTAAS
jgi:hypothetical protein